MDETQNQNLSDWIELLEGREPIESGKHARTPLTIGAHHARGQPRRQRSK